MDRWTHIQAFHHDLRHKCGLPHRAVPKLGLMSLGQPVANKNRDHSCAFKAVGLPPLFSCASLLLIPLWSHRFCLIALCNFGLFLPATRIAPLSFFARLPISQCYPWTKYLHIEDYWRYDIYTYIDLYSFFFCLPSVTMFVLVVWTVSLVLHMPSPFLSSLRLHLVSCVRRLDVHGMTSRRFLDLNDPS